MKKVILALAILTTGFCHQAIAQVSVNVNIGAQPLWGPTGYDYAEYYYIPDVDAYYDVANGVYVYNEDGRWMTMATLPARYSGFDLYNAHKVVINEPNPWMRDAVYSRQYYSYRGRHDQSAIRDSRDNRYWANPTHPNHSMWSSNTTHEQHRQYTGNRPQQIHQPAQVGQTNQVRQTRQVKQVHTEAHYDHNNNNGHH